MSLGKLAKFVEKIAKERGILSNVRSDIRKVKNEAKDDVKYEHLENYFK
jgi:hypothetical protein